MGSLGLCVTQPVGGSSIVTISVRTSPPIYGLKGQRLCLVAAWSQGSFSEQTRPAGVTSHIDNKSIATKVSDHVLDIFAFCCTPQPEPLTISTAVRQTFDLDL